MHGHRHRHHHGFRRGHGRFPSREEWIRRLEEYQRDLEQEVADIADVLRHLREDRPAETGTV